MQNKLQISLPDLNATSKLANLLANMLMPGQIIYLQGQLGAGKTTLVRHILAALGHKGITKSPTYTLVETYTLGDLTLHHFDLYRLADPSELEFIGIREYLSGQAICMFEWPEKGQGNIPAADVVINLLLQGAGRSATIMAQNAFINELQAAYARDN